MTILNISMNYKTFTSSVSEDKLSVDINLKQHKAYFHLEVIENLEDNFKVLADLIEYLKLQDVKWIIIPYSNNFKLPRNTVYSKGVTNLSIHIEDFEKFYIDNVSHIIKPNNIYIKTIESDSENSGEEWITVVDKKKEKRKKVNEFKNKLNSINEDWTRIS